LRQTKSTKDKKRTRKSSIPQTIELIHRNSDHNRITHGSNRKIEAAFKTNRGSVFWNNPRSRRQVECECGPRTIKRMLEICTGISEEVSIDECVKKATITHQIEDFRYDPGEV